MVFKKAFLLLVLLSSMVSSASAASYWWKTTDDGVQDRFWNNTNNWWWSGGGATPTIPPTTADWVDINKGFSITTPPEIDANCVGDSAAVCLRLSVADWQDYMVPPTASYLYMTGGELEVVDWVVVGATNRQQDNNEIPASFIDVGVFEMQGGAVTIGTNISLGGTGEYPWEVCHTGGDGTLNMRGGTITAGGTLYIPEGNGPGRLNFYGGTIEINDLVMNPGDPNGSMDINGVDARMFINGDKTAKVNIYISNGWITSPGGPESIRVEYDSNSNKTQVTIGEPLPPVTLTINVEPNSVGIDTVYPDVGQHVYNQGWQIDINATTFNECPAIYSFDYWDGDVNDPNSPSSYVIMDTNKTITAFFVDARKCGDECHPILQEDLNEDCYIDFTDFATFSNNWLSCTHPDCDPCEP